MIIGVLASSEGTTLQARLDATAAGDLDATVGLDLFERLLHYASLTFPTAPSRALTRTHRRGDFLSKVNDAAPAARRSAARF